ncbi:MAG: sodium:alanine symporter family protein [Pseudomonadales bacterium]|jgi:AGCS family alanine or glycine:cation symporter|nr:sodium:alanine symporter family protein [Pseudomonadales bacterium]MDP6473059.1 sodium:alanine symporter family protein [Pseudomonadales bacterium]MDP6826184.1 sodium:alanine symporter family protein [Pseudomonadales bacterium]MDP6973439.1 sodium:alanine symporter family protein [Pseudomonadales bacterium]
MEWLETLFGFLDELLGSAVYFPFLLLAVGLFFTLYLGFPQIRFFRHAWDVLRGKETPGDAPGDTSHFQALSTALSGTVGTGNIGGVAFAIYLGGPAALFWMWMTAFLGMTTKYVEVTISHQYRTRDEQGRMAGGPMYYMERGLNMRWLAVFFALATVVSSFGSGNMPQSNNVAAGIEASFGVPPWITGAVLSVLLGAVIVGGIRRIAVVAASIVPVMGVLYAIGAVAVAMVNYDQLLPSFAAIFENAFNGSAAAGGFLGASFAYAFNRGVNRGLFSNEAGQGSAAIAHASARTEKSVSEGMVSILEPFIDTLVICTLTGLVILSSGVWTEKFENTFSPIETEFVSGSYSESNPGDVAALFAHLDLSPPQDDPVRPWTGTLQVRNGVALLEGVTVIHNRSIAEDVTFVVGSEAYSGDLEVAGGKLSTAGVELVGRSLLHSVPLTAEAFKRGLLGDWGQYVVTVGLALFAFSTAIAWSYYGDRAMTFLFGVQTVMPYRMVYVLGFFCATIIDTSLIWLISAVTLALMTLPNLIGLVLMRKEVRSLTRDYWDEVRARRD